LHVNPSGDLSADRQKSSGGLVTDMSLVPKFPQKVIPKKISASRVRT